MERLIDSFTGDDAFLSNFFAARMDFEGAYYPTSEHAYQASKTMSRIWRTKIATAPTSRIAKQLGRKAPLRHDWPMVKVPIMRAVVRAKFTQHPELAKMLLATGDAQLIEGNTWNDAVWGCIRDQTGAWKGQNWLGRILMEVREELRKVKV